LSAICVLFPGRTYKNIIISIRDGKEWHRHRLSQKDAEHLMRQLKVNLDAYKTELPELGFEHELVTQT